MEQGEKNEIQHRQPFERYRDSEFIVLVGFIITIGKIIAANTKALTQLQDSINRLDKTLDKQGANIERVESEVNEHETRITILENKGDGGK